MFQLVAQIDSLDARFENEFKTVMESGTGEDVKAWMLDNCALGPVEVPEVWEDAIIQDPKYLITYIELMCETVSLYLI